MKRVIFALGILFFYHNTTVAQLPKFVQQINTNAYGEGLFDFTGHINPGGEKYFFPIDFNNDGYKDLIGISFYQGPPGRDVFRLRFFQNNQKGTFDETTSSFKNSITNGIYTIPARNNAPVIFDFNKDGKQDFLYLGGWENDDYSNYDTKFGYVKLRDYFYKYNPNDLEKQYNGSWIRPFFYYQDSSKFIDGYSLFDTKTFSDFGAADHQDMDNDGFDDLLVTQKGIVVKDSSITNWLNGIVIWKNDNGKGFKFNQHLSFLDTLNHKSFGEELGNITVTDFNNDGYKDILVYGGAISYTPRYTQNGIDSSMWSINYREYRSSVLTLETRLYLNNKGKFDVNNYVVIPNVRAKFSKAIDINNDGKMDFIAQWKNDRYPGGYLDTSTNKDGINTQYYVMINKGNNTFVDSTIKYFPKTNYKFTRLGVTDFDLKDIDNDGFLDIIPFSGGDDSLYNQYGTFSIDVPGNQETYYYKNFGNQYFNKVTVDSFLIHKEWYKLNDIRNVDSFYNKVIIQSFQNSTNPLPIKGKYLLDRYNYLNHVVIDDFNKDGKIDLLGYTDYSSGSSYLATNDKVPLGIALILQCNPIKPLFNSSKYSFCSGDSLKLSVSNINKGDTLKWFYGTKSDLSNVTNKTFTDSTKLFVTRTDSLGCAISSDTVSLVKYTVPTAPVLSRDTANNLVSSINGITWYKDGVALTDTTQKIKPTTGGSYTAKTTQNGCISTLSTPYYYLVTDIINLSADEYIKLAPNPFTNQLNFDFVVKGYQRLNMEVFDIATGSKVASQPNLIAGSRITLGQLSTGTYIIRVTSNDQKIIQQFKVVKL
jgi:hypothetical protein